MKRCPECRRDYFDDSLLYCLEDGAALIQGSVPSPDEPVTAILSSEDLSYEAPTRAQVNTTDGSTVFPTASDDLPARTVSRKNSLIAGIVGIVLVTTLGIGSYLYYGRSASNQIESVAVMPFFNDSGNADVEYLSDGMTETLISSLTRLPNLNVKSRSTVFRYKGKDTNLKTIGKELDVQSILTGHVTQRGDQLILSLELVDAATENAIWSQQYSRKQSDLVALQSEIAKDVSIKLKAKLSGAEESKVTQLATSDPEAYQDYLKGRFFWNQRGQGPGRLAAAIEQFKAAVSKDPNYGLAYAGLADCYVLMPQETGVPPGEALPQAKAYANRALEIDESMSEAHATLGLINESLWQWADAQKEFERSIELNPNYPTAHQWYSGLLGVMGRKDERLSEIKKAYELDPLSSVISINVGMAHLERSELSAAAEQFNKTIEFSPNYFVAHFALSITYLRLGRPNEALLEAQKSVELSKRHSYALSLLGYVNGATGNRNEALAIIREFEQKPVKGESDKFFIAAIYSGLGDKDQAFAWLEKSFQENNSFMTNLRIEPLFAPLSEEPRFKDILRRMGLPE